MTLASDKLLFSFEKPYGSTHCSIHTHWITTGLIQEVGEPCSVHANIFLEHAYYHQDIIKPELQ